jgi:hypothetical protein
VTALEALNQLTPLMTHLLHQGHKKRPCWRFVAQNLGRFAQT